MDAYEELGLLGSGSFGNVYKIRRKSDGKQLVWKELNYGRMSEKEKVLQTCRGVRARDPSVFCRTV